MKNVLRLSALFGGLLLFTWLPIVLKAQNVNNITKATTHASLHAAIDMADPGDSLEVVNDINEGLVSVSKTLKIVGNPANRTITSASPNFGIYIGAVNVLIKGITVQGAGTFGFITAPGSNGLVLEGVRAQNCGGSGFAITCVNNVLLKNIGSNSNGGNAVTITDCQNVTIDGISTDGNNQFTGLPSTGGIGIYASGTFCTGGVNNVNITGNVNIAEFVVLFEQVVGSGAINGVSFAPGMGSTPAALPYYVGATMSNKAYVKNINDAYECAASLIAVAGTVPFVGYTGKDVFINEIATGNKYVGANLTALPLTPPNMYPNNPPYTLCITTAVDNAENGDTIFVGPGKYYEQVVVDKKVAILGPDAGSDPCPMSAFTACIAPDSIGKFNGGAKVALLTIGSDSVTIGGLLFDGDNTNLNSGFPSLGADIDADFGIVANDFYKGLKISNNVVQNVDEVGIQIKKAGTPMSLLDENMLTYNKIFNVPGLTMVGGFGIEIDMEFTTSVDNNCIDACKRGLVIAGATSATVTNNDFSQNAKNDMTDITVDGSSTGLVSCNGYNGFYDVTIIGVENNSGKNLDAKNNWWGDASGPSGQGTGNGAQAGVNVDFCPWLDNVPATGMPVPNCDPISIAGVIRWMYNLNTGVNQVVVDLTGDATDQVTTAAPNDGEYRFVVSNGTNFVVTPTKDINKFNGVTSNDAVRIQQHIGSGFGQFTTPYQWVAADVNLSNSITTADAAIIFQSLLGNPVAEGLFKGSWRFVPLSHVFPPPVNISLAFWNFPEDLNVMVQPFVPSVDNDFVGIKIGDLDGDADPDFRPVSELTSFMLSTLDQTLVTGQEITVPVSIDGFKDIVAFQYALAFDPQVLAFEGMDHNPASGLTEGNFGLFNIAQGELRSAMAQPNSVSYDNGLQHFNLRFKVLQGGAQLSAVLKLETAELPALAFENGSVQRPVELVFTTTSGTVNALNESLNVSVRPNPAHTSANIFFNLPESGDVQLRLIDMSGRLLAEKQAFFPAGLNNVTLQMGETTGMLLLEVQSATGKSIVKVIAE